MTTPIFERKNVLVTGGAGFFGVHLCERLIREANVICLDDFSNSHPENISHLLQYPNFEFINYDVNQPFEVENFPELDKFKVKFQGIQEIYHLACPTSPKKFESLRVKTLLANSAAIINTLELAVKYKAKHLFTSSAVIYGQPPAHNGVFAEGDQGILNHLSARACYDEGKRFAETCSATYQQMYGIDAKIARVFSTYGPRLRLFEKQLIPDFIINALEGKDLVIYGDETFSTSLCYISDTIDGLVRLMAAEPEVRVVNFGGEEAVKYTTVAQKIIELTNSSSKLAFDSPLLFLTAKGIPDIRYARETLGWFPLVRLEDGLRKTIDYVISHKESLLFSHYAK